MGFGNTRDKRRAAAQKHAERIHKCQCGRIIKGNGYYMHKKNCGGSGKETK